MSHSASPKEFIKSLISDKRKELCAFEGVVRELTDKEATIKRQEKLIEHLMKSVEKSSPNKSLNAFIDNNISYDFKYPKGLKLTEIYQEYCSWREYFYCPEFEGWGDEQYPPKSMKYIKDYLDRRFKPSFCGRTDPFYVVYFGLSFNTERPHYPLSDRSRSTPLLS